MGRKGDGETRGRCSTSILIDNDEQVLCYGKEGVCDES